MKFIIKNESTRTHVLDRDLHHGQSAEYTAEDFAKICKGVAIAMGTMKLHLQNGQTTDAGGMLGFRSKDPDLRVYCEVDGQRVELTPEDAAGFVVPVPEAPKVETKAETKAETKK